MNQLKVFKSQEFGRIRSVMIDGTPWFVGKDVAEVLGYRNGSRDVNRHVEDEDRMKDMVFDGNQNKETILINKSGVYSLILSSKLPTAKRFKHWVTSEVLPSLYENGGYIVGQEQMTERELLASAFLVSQRIAEERAARIEELEVEAQAQAEQLAITEPKAEYYDAFVHTKTSTGIRVTAKELDVGERKFINLLIDKGFLYRDKQGDLLPYAERNRGYFIVREVASNHWMGKQTFITEKGKQHFRKLCQKDGLIQPDQEIVTVVRPSDTFIM